ncbi:hypothetical protein TCON_1385 [Astathelohania contejeani]|uniref:Uncharacterized protein n=1 Tax=Astathelohania contejeani TaxID=164912 RepID=A0ABQ7HYZ3_9MICR|nr:hypothetical protein TCON_1385 [Thelohania contejeani]
MENFKEQLSIYDDIGVISDEYNINFIPYIYQLLIKLYPKKNIFILEPLKLICDVKKGRAQFYITIGAVCPLHPIKHSISVNHLLSLTENKFLNETIYYKLENNVKEFDRIRFLISRLARTENIKKKQIFGIFYSSPIFTELAVSISKYLSLKEKDSYLICLKNISWERLTCYDIIDCYVIIDCPMFTYFELDLFVVTPFEIQMGFADKWEGGYSINEFNPIIENINVNKSKELVLKYSKSGELLLKREFIGLEYENSDVDNTINLGLKGKASGYKKISKESDLF